MKKIKDERLLMENLKSIRFAFLFQTIGIMGILVYSGIKNGVANLLNNPLWLLLLGTAVILGFFNVRNAVDLEDHGNEKKPRPLSRKGFLAGIIGVSCTILLLFAPDVTVRDAIIIGVVLFLSFFLTFSLIHLLRKKRDED
jgi:hypothetical protein